MNIASEILAEIDRHLNFLKEKRDLQGELYWAFVSLNSIKAFILTSYDVNKVPISNDINSECKWSRFFDIEVCLDCKKRRPFK